MVETNIDNLDSQEYRAGVHWQFAGVLAKHWADGIEAELFSNSYFGSSFERPETYLWIVVSEEQSQNLKHSSPRRKLRRLTEAFLDEIDVYNPVLGLNRPYISLVRESRVEELFSWVTKQGLLLD